MFSYKIYSKKNIPFLQRNTIFIAKRLRLTENNGVMDFESIGSQADICIEQYNKVHIFWEGHKFLQNLHQLFVLCSASQIIGGDFTKLCGFLRIYEFC